MACGVPVIVNNASALPEVVGDAGRLVEAADCHQVAAALRDIACNGDLRDEMRQRGLARAAEFSWERTARQTLCLYEAAACRRQPPPPIKAASRRQPPPAIKASAEAQDY